MINLLQSQTRKEAVQAAGTGGENAIDPVLGQESSHCQPLIRIAINQERIEQPGPKIE